jgi:hypothetical protein
VFSRQHFGKLFDECGRFWGANGTQQPPLATIIDCKSRSIIKEAQLFFTTAVARGGEMPHPNFFRKCNEMDKFSEPSVFSFSFSLFFLHSCAGISLCSVPKDLRPVATSTAMMVYNLLGWFAGPLLTGVLPTLN